MCRAAGHEQPGAQQRERRERPERAPRVPRRTGGRGGGARDEPQGPDAPRGDDGQVQADEGTHRVADDVDAREPERVEHGDQHTCAVVDGERRAGRRGRAPARQVDEHEPAGAEAVGGGEERRPRGPRAGDAVQQEDGVRPGAVVHDDRADGRRDRGHGQRPPAGVVRHRPGCVRTGGDGLPDGCGVGTVHRASRPCSRARLRPPLLRSRRRRGGPVSRPGRARCTPRGGRAPRGTRPRRAAGRAR